MSRSIRFVTAWRKSQSNCYLKFLPAISLFCPLFHFFACYFKKNSKLTNQSDLRNNAQHVIKLPYRTIGTKYYGQHVKCYIFFIVCFIASLSIYRNMHLRTRRARDSTKIDISVVKIGPLIIETLKLKV